ncbi:hypothetical protein AWC38_SpisGene10526 [Stylophora pistillata]|uniref:Reverse transcriptase domain-containing protein n=1 Tax=Stylophora pistillata TaxID=50429 RepID=A0A2B4S8U3_STYPI|nr:hypothetical protein AWC38_SpisGene10526 [Stylophora pistillata]
MACLSRWKVGGSRNELISRVKDYTKNGLDKKLVDPDNGVNIAQKMLKLGLTEEIVSPEIKENFPSNGFTFVLGIDSRCNHLAATLFAIEVQSTSEARVKEVEALTGKRMALSFKFLHAVPTTTTPPQSSNSATSTNSNQNLWELSLPESRGPLSSNDIAVRADSIKKALYNSVQKRDAKLKYTEAVEIAVAMETALHDASESQTLPVTFGVPHVQGSVLGPTLFSLSFNDLPNITERIDGDPQLHMYADNTAIYVLALSYDLVAPKLNEVQAKLCTWSCENCLCLHPTNSEHMLLSGCRQLTGPDKAVKMGSYVIEEAVSTRCLGV